MATTAASRHAAPRGAPAAHAQVPQAVPEGLVYSSDAQPGIRRVRSAGGFRYQQQDGRRVRAAAVLERIRRLAIPPAYEDVWICPSPQGHLQATGRDARGRKQYRYHADWRLERDAGKYDRMREFGRLLPRLRRQLQRDLREPPDERRRAAPRRSAPQRAARRPSEERSRLLATVARLLDATCARVGNDAYARENGSFGLTTLRSRHVQVRGGTLRLVFKGKGGVLHDLRIEDARLARIVRRCQELPGQALFQYRGADGALHGIASEDVNGYLRRVARCQCSAKDFRTWHGSVLALESLRQALQAPQDPQQRFTLRGMLAEVARFLGNTPAVCRKSYVHPLVLALAQVAVKDAAAALAMLDRLAARAGRERQAGLLQPERRFMALMGDRALHRRLEAMGACAATARRA